MIHDLLISCDEQEKTGENSANEINNNTTKRRRKINTKKRPRAVKAIAQGERKKNNRKLRCTATTQADRAYIYVGETSEERTPHVEKEALLVTDIL